MNAGPIVIKLGGRALDSADQHGGLWDALAALAGNANDGLVIVHGGGGAVDAHLERLGLTSERKAGLRVTPDAQIGEVVAVLRGKVNMQLVGLLCSRGTRAVGLGLADGGACVCEKLEPEGIDLGRVGRVIPHRQEAGATGALWRELLGAGFVPVICSIGADSEGGPLNVNADDAALGVAQILGASMLVLLTDVPGVLDSGGSLIDQTDAAEIERLIESGAIAGGMIPKARAAAAGAEIGGIPTVIASWTQADRLAGLAAGEHVGTRVMPKRQRPIGAGR